MCPSEAGTLTHRCSGTGSKEKECACPSLPLLRLSCPHHEFQPLSRQPFSNFLPKAPHHQRGICSGDGVSETDSSASVKSPLDLSMPKTLYPSTAVSEPQWSWRPFSDSSTNLFTYSLKKCSPTGPFLNNRSSPVTLPGGLETRGQDRTKQTNKQK